jgi:hypothetical protein
MSLNELQEGLFNDIAPTDSRLRPDQRMYENGKLEEAELEKQRLEQKQRDARKRIEANGDIWKPLWFELMPDKYGQEGNAWKYKGGYFETKGKYTNYPDIFSEASIE